MQKTILTILLLFISLTWLHAQQINVQGIINDETGEPLAGANIRIKGTNRWIINDIDGKFAIDCSKGDTLVFSYMGYLADDVIALADTIGNVTMIDIESARQFFGEWSESEVFYLKGEIVDAQTGKPIDNVNVIRPKTLHSQYYFSGPINTFVYNGPLVLQSGALAGKDVGEGKVLTRSDRDGNYTTLANDDTEIEFSHPHYQTKIIRAKRTQCDIELEPR